MVHLTHTFSYTEWYRLYSEERGLHSQGCHSATEQDEIVPVGPTWIEVGVIVQNDFIKEEKTIIG